jgi:hypothetical protein
MKFKIIHGNSLEYLEKEMWIETLLRKKGSKERRKESKGQGRKGEGRKKEKRKGGKMGEKRKEREKYLETYILWVLLSSFIGKNIQLKDNQMC